MNNVVMLVRSASNNENNYCSQLLRGKCMYQLAKLYITNVICFFFSLFQHMVMSPITAKQWKSNYQKVMKYQYYKSLSNDIKKRMAHRISSKLLSKQN